VAASIRLTNDGKASRAPTDEFDAIVTVKVDQGWHIYANPTGVAELVPTTLKLASGPVAPASLVRVSYPKGEAKVLGAVGTEKVTLYEGTVEFTARLRLSDQAKPGTVHVTLQLEYQACNDRVCQAPAHLELPLDVPVGQ
jgi:DsbC/DsbD-like thiol-disulfide interchange protein